MAVEYVVDFVGHGIIECGDDPQPHPTHTGALHGTVHLKTTVLMTPEEVDQAVKKSPAYRAPGT